MLEVIHSKTFTGIFQVPGARSLMEFMETEIVGDEQKISSWGEKRAPFIVLSS